MFPDETRKRQERLSNEIYFLAQGMLNTQNKEQLDVIARLQKIYKDGFKHYYSDLFPVVLAVFDENSQYNKEYLTGNLETIRNELELDYSNGIDQFKDIYSQFTKLCDHLNLQISELNVFSEIQDRTKDATELMSSTNGELRIATKDLQQATMELEQTTPELVKANKKADSLQTELIAVLSIFAAIVITFSGGITFLGSVMTSIKDVNYFESIILAAIVCGMVLFNTIFLMMYMVSKITERSIYAKCLTENCSCEGQNCKCSGIKRIRKRLPYVYYFNVFAVVGIAADLVIWFLDIKDIII